MCINKPSSLTSETENGVIHIYINNLHSYVEGVPRVNPPNYNMRARAREYPISTLFVYRDFPLL
jgi:hypothetical protein